MAKPETLTDSNFQAQVIESTQPVVVDFSATWCPPCRALEPVLEELTQEYSGRVKVGKIDADRDPQSVTRYQIRGLPTVLFFKNGEVVDSLVGAVPKSRLAEKFDALIETTVAV
jgi:thioredoxin 1